RPASVVENGPGAIDHVSVRSKGRNALRARRTYGDVGAGRQTPPCDGLRAAMAIRVVVIGGEIAGYPRPFEGKIDRRYCTTPQFVQHLPHTLFEGTGQCPIWCERGRIHVNASFVEECGIKASREVANFQRGWRWVRIQIHRASRLEVQDITRQ